MFDLTLQLLTFLTAIGVSTFAMVSGGEGAIIFTPFFIGLGIEPTQAISTAFLTQLFGKTSGTIGYHLKKEKHIQWNIVLMLILFSAPFVVIGSYFTYMLTSSIVKTLFGGMILVLALLMAYSFRKQDSNRESVNGREITKLSFVPAIAGFLTGIFSIGAGTINMVLLERILKLRIIKTVATVVATMAITALFGSIVHAYYGLRWDIIPFTVSGVLIGGQIGPRIASWLDKKQKSHLIKILFITLTIIVGSIMIISSF